MCNPLKYINESIPGEKKKGPSEYNLETGKCTQVNFNIKSMYFGVCVCVYYTYRYGQNRFTVVST